jgi:hypothetical protein
MNIPKSRAKTAYGVLSEVRKLILQEPLRYDQTNILSFKEIDNEYDTYPSCGTVGCIAGWITVLTCPKPKRETFPWDYAVDRLGLTWEQSIALFTAVAADGEGQTRYHARSGAEHIARFQKKFEKQLRAKRI